MRNFKKFLALVLATLMVVSAAATVSAYSDVADDNIYAAAIDALTEYGIVNGTSEDVYSPDADVLRFQMALMMARALEPEVKDWNDGLAVFTDVNEWYGAIAYAYTNNIVTGIGNGLFAPRAGIRYQDALIMAVRALGYDVDTTCDPYWIEAYKIAGNIGLTNGVKVTDPAKTLTRAETAQVIYNMLKATPADGGATIEEKNFGVAGANNVTTVIVTATEKQQYDKAAKPAEAGYVGVQVVANGIPTGEVKYYPAALLGIESDKIEDSFAHAFDLVNYDAKKDTFVKVVAGLEPVVVNGTDVAINTNTGKITINGTVYYAVEEITGAALKNEFVVYAGGAVAETNSVLVVDKNGNVYNKDNQIVATAVDVNGTTLYLYDGVFHTENEARKAFGITVPGAAVNYTTYTADMLSALKKNYQISLYDDNRDGKYDRATIAKLYMDVYNPNNGNGEAQFGEMKGKKVSFTNTDLKKGDVIVYTYNADTGVVNVVDVLAKGTGVLTKINTTNKDSNDAGKYKSVVVTISGNEYVLANADRMNAGYIGAEVKTTAGAQFNKITENATMDFVNWDDLVIGGTVNFVAYGNTIIAAQSVAAGDPYDVVVANEITDITSDSIIVSAYANGVLKTDIEVSSVKIGNTEYVFSKLNMFALSAAVNTINNNFNAHDFFQVRTKADGTVSLTLTVASNEYKTIDDVDGKYSFDAGIADKVNNVLNNAKAIRTSASTVFYFFGTDGMKVFVGTPANGKTIDASKATIYANKYGYGSNGWNGVSGVVIVESNTTIADCTNFFEAAQSPVTTIVLLDDSALTYVKATAETLGISGSGVYRAYSVDGVNLTDGSQVKTIYVKDADANSISLKARKAYTVTKDNFVVTAETTVANTLANAGRNSFDMARTWTITGAESLTKVNTVKLTKSDKYDFKTNNINDVLAADATYTIEYVVLNDGKTFLGIAYKNASTTPSTPSLNENEVNVTFNAEYRSGNPQVASVAEYKYDVNADGAVTGTFTATNASTANVAAQTKLTADIVKFVAAPERTFEIAKITLNGTEKSVADYDLTATINDNGTVTFTLAKAPDFYSGRVALEAGNYYVSVKTDIGSYCILYVNVK